MPTAPLTTPLHNVAGTATRWVPLVARITGVATRHTAEFEQMRRMWH